MQKKLLNSVKIRYPPSVKKLELILDKLRDLLTLPNSDLRENGVIQVILFGSYSKNQYRWGSDVDLLFILKEESEVEFEEVYDVLLSLSNEFAWAPIVKCEKEIQKMCDENYFWIIDALKTGKTIWKVDQTVILV